MHPEFGARLHDCASGDDGPAIGACPIADNSFDHVAISGVTMERLVDALLARKELKPDEKDEIEGGLATVAFRQVIPLT